MSAIKSILLHLDASAQSASRLQFARDLAQRHAAKVTALFGAQSTAEEMPLPYSAGAAIASLAVAQHSKEREQARASLQRSALGDGPEVAWFDIVGDSIVHGFVQEAAYADLLVLGQQSSGVPNPGGAPAGFNESVIIGSGRPALVIPGNARMDATGRRALVAWNGSAQAAHALTAALPLLRLADEVHVVTWSRGSALAPFSWRSIDHLLQPHGITTTPHRREPSNHVGEELLAMVRQVNADLLVMGCYGRSRTSELVLGGATRSVLGAMPVPVLMMH